MSTTAILYLAICVLLGVPLIVLILRVLAYSAEISRRARLARVALEIGRSADAAVERTLPVADGLRRRTFTAEAAQPPLTTALDELRSLAREAEATDRRTDGGHGSASLSGEIERAVRAIELVEHGRALIAANPSDGVGEGETSIKRGYLGLQHAREAIRVGAEQVAAAARKRS